MDFANDSPYRGTRLKGFGRFIGATVNTKESDSTLTLSLLKLALIEISVNEKFMNN